MRIFLFCLLAVCVQYAHAQEILRSIGCNPAQYRHRNESRKHMQMRLASLPFVDDFSDSSDVPNPLKWINAGVYVNATYPVSPPTIGVATFDGLAENGLPYDTTTNGTGTQSPRSGDTLTSQPLDFSSYNVGDNLYLSFFYEAQGNGDYPNIGDSLILEFKADTVWRKIWGRDGSVSAPSNAFRQVMIPIDSAAYFTSTFQFRFRNLASIVGNNDHWHIDYVKLAANRSLADTVLNDIAVQYRPPSLLQNYTEMPWNQFKVNPGGELRPTDSLTARNNYNSLKNFTYGFASTDVLTGTLLSPSFPIPFPNDNIAALSSLTKPLSGINVSTIVNNTNADIRTMYVAKLTGSGDALTTNDTTYTHLRFGHYLAYDDGSAERAYGLLGTSAEAAIYFHLNVPDTLRAVQIHWARVTSWQGNLLFNIKVWKSLTPEVTLYEQTFLHPMYVDSMNGWTTYKLDTPIAVSDSFFVGWQPSQFGANPPVMDLGFDQNTDTHHNLHINIGSGWSQSQFPGSVMLRAWLGSAADAPFTTSIVAIRQPDWTMYPNPVDDLVNVKGAPENCNYQLSNALGQTLSTGTVQHQHINVKLAPGIYFLRVISGKESKTFRLVKS